MKQYCPILCINKYILLFKTILIISWMDSEKITISANTERMSKNIEIAV